MKISKLKVATLLTKEEVSLSKVLINGTFRYLGDPAAPLIFDLEYLLNTTVELIESTSYIGQFANGTMKGMGAQVLNGEADLGADSSLFLPYRVKALTFLHPIHTERYHVHFKQPSAISAEHFLFLKPFSTQIWLAILIMLIILIISSLSCFKILKNSLKFGNTSNNIITNGEIILWAIAATCNRSYNLKECEASSFKIILFFGMLFGTIIFSIYSAFIVSFLSFEANPIKSFGDLILYGYTITARKEFPISVFLQNEKDLKRLSTMSEKVFKTQQDSILKVYKSNEESVELKHAFLELQGFFYTQSKKLGFSDREMCKISQISSISKYPLGMFIKKNSELKEILNQKILKLLENGLIERYLKHSKDLIIPRCSGDPANFLKPHSLTLPNFYVVLYFFIFSAVFVLLLLFVERFIFEKKYYWNV